VCVRPIASTARRVDGHANDPEWTIAPVPRPIYEELPRLVGGHLLTPAQFDGPARQGRRRLRAETGRACRSTCFVHRCCDPDAIRPSCDATFLGATDDGRPQALVDPDYDKTRRIPEFPSGPTPVRFRPIPGPRMRRAQDLAVSADPDSEDVGTGLPDPRPRKWSSYSTRSEAGPRGVRFRPRPSFPRPTGQRQPADAAVFGWSNSNPTAVELSVANSAGSRSVENYAVHGGRAGPCCSTRCSAWSSTRAGANRSAARPFLHV